MNKEAMYYVKWLANYKTKLEPIKPAILAMMMLETGRGKSKLFTDYKNAHGQKYRSFLDIYCEPVSYEAHDGVTDYCDFDDYEDELDAMEERLDHYSGYSSWRRSLLPNERFPCNTFMNAIAETWAPKQNYESKVMALYEEACELLDLHTKKEEAPKEQIEMEINGDTFTISFNTSVLKRMLLSTDKPDLVIPKIEQPLAGKTIVIDVGHGYNTKSNRFDGGAYNSNEDIKEFDLNTSLADEMQTLIQSLGGHSITLKNIDVGNKLSLSDRYRLAEDYKADVFVSVHHNSYIDPTVQGTETLYNHFKELAECIQNGMVNKLGFYNRKAKYKGGLGVIKSTKVPSVLIEPYFLSNEGITKSNAHQMSRLAGRGVVDGLKEYFTVIG